MNNAVTQPGNKCFQLTSPVSTKSLPSIEEEFDFDEEPSCENNSVTDLDTLLSQMSESEKFHTIPDDFDCYFSENTINERGGNIYTRISDQYQFPFSSVSARIPGVN